MKKLLNLLRSRVIVTVVTAVLDIFILTGQLPAEIKSLGAQLITGLGALYVAFESVADIVSRIKKVVD